MDMSSISTVISNLGFPIVMCLLLYRQMLKQDQRHDEEMEKLRESLNNNTIAISQLTSKLEEAKKVNENAEQ